MLYSFSLPCLHHGILSFSYSLDFLPLQISLSIADLHCRIRTCDVNQALPAPIKSFSFPMYQHALCSNERQFCVQYNFPVCLVINLVFSMRVDGVVLCGLRSSYTLYSHCEILREMVRETL